ncbi:MAG TPA: EamA family transporter [Lacunisphaera sp.]|jgi:transporter family protein|nr:EamA family transporter [Lacunisphaera sp.]
MWWTYALLSAVLAALTAILAKVGVRGIDSNLATAVRTSFILPLAWVVVAAQGNLGLVGGITRVPLVYLGLSAVATGASWLCYFKALQLGPASLVSAVDKSSLALTILLAALFLGETLTLRTALGCGLILAGVAVVAWPA